MRYTLTPEKAIVTLRECAAARKKWGKHVSPPLTIVQLLEAVELAADAGCFDEDRVSLTPEERTRLNRQRGMAKARALRHPGNSPESDISHVSEE